jgi:hypothetical protein
MKKWVTMVLILTCLTSFTACGYLLYPERRGQEGGQIDAVVALLDAALLLLFIVPGVVAFAVDFTTGAIYLPDGKTGELKVVMFDPGQRMNKQSLERMLADHLGKPVSLDPGSTLFFDAEGKTPNELKVILNALNAGIRDEAALRYSAGAFQLKQAIL